MRFDWTIKDLVEITFIFICFYRLSQWLSKDKKNLLLWFWGYVSLFIFSYAFNLTSLVILLIFSAPLLINILCMIHQDLIQRSFIAPLKQDSKHDQKDWVSILIKECLAATYHDKQIAIIIETQLDISQYISSMLRITTPLHPSVITLLTQSQLYQQEYCIVVDQTGVLIGINAHVPFLENIDLYNSAGVNEIQSITLKLECLLLIASPKTHLFDMVIDGKIYHHKTAIQARELLSRYVDKHAHTKEKGDVSYVKNQKPYHRTNEH